jgi:hypothetical protein
VQETAKRARSVLTTLGLGLICVALASAQAPVERDPGAPGEEHRRLEALAGTWDVTLEIPIGNGRLLEGKAACEAVWVLDGRFLRLEYTSTFGGRPLTVVRYLGFDRHRGKFVEVHFESTHTDVMNSEGSLSEDGKTITSWGTHVDAATGQAVRVRTVTTLSGSDAFTLEMVYTDAEGRDAKTIELVHARSKGE